MNRASERSRISSHRGSALKQARWVLLVGGALACGQPSVVPPGGAEVALDNPPADAGRLEDAAKQADAGVDALPPAVGNGLWGEYFNDASLGKLALRRGDDAIDFAWGKSAPHSSVSVPGFSARWTGQISAPTTGSYKITVEASGGVRLWIGGDEIVDDWEAAAAAVHTGTVQLAAGERYSLRLEYRALPESANIHLRWSGPKTSDSHVPRDALFFTQLEPASLVYATTAHRYAYAPSVVREGAAEHIYFCHNRDSDVIRDYILHIKRVNGQVVAEDIAIGPSPGGWDSKHICDPSVVKANVSWNGKAYRYAMFFLGTEQDNTHNQMGLALADSLDGPWTKYPEPLITYPYPYPVPVAQQCWGVGQPSATTVDDQGHILLFYTQGGCDRTWARRSEIQIGNLDAPVVKAPIDLPVNGLIDGRGAQDLINSFDVAYDPSRDRFYIVRERHQVPGAPDDLEVNSIAADAIWSGVGTWRFEAALTPDLIGTHKVHNAGLERDVWGTLADPTAPRVYVTAACNCGFPSILWSYWDHAIRMVLR